jgi:translocation and assembly module TamB
MQKKTTVIIIVIIAVIAIGALSWQLQSQSVLQNITSNIAQEMSIALGLPVKIGSIVVNSWNSVTLRQIEIADDNDQPILLSDQVDVTLSLWEMLWGKESALQMIKEIHFFAPQLFVTKGDDGKWNIEQLIKEKAPGQPSLRSLVTLDQGSVTMKLPQGSWTIDGLTGQVNLENSPAAAIDLAGELDGKAVTVAGVVNNGVTNRLRIAAAQVDLQQFLPLLDGDAQFDKLKLIAGQLEDLTLVAVSEQDKPLLFSGESELKEVAVNLDDNEIQHVNGFVTFTQDRLDFYRTSATLAGQPFTVSGQVFLNTSESVVDLAVTASHFDLAALPVSVAATGQVSADVHVAGPVSGLVIDGTVTADNLTACGYTISHGQAQIHLANQQLAFKNLSAAMLGGILTADGQVNLTDQTGSINVAGRHIDSAALLANANTSGIAVSGYSDFDAYVNGPLNPAQAAVSAQVVLADGSLQKGAVQNVAFHNLKTAFTKTAAGDITLEYASADIANGSVSAQGTVNKGLIDLAVLVQQVDAAVLAPTLDNLPVAGRVTLSGKVTGSTENPQLSTQIYAEQGQVLGQPFDSLSGSMIATTQQVSLQNVQSTYNRTLVSGQPDFRTPLVVTTQSINGTIELTGNQTVNLTLKAHAARAEDIVKLLLPGEDLTGNVDADVTLSGSLQQLDAVAAITFTDGSFRGYLVRNAKALVRRSQGVTTVDKMTVHALPATLELSGTIDANQQMNFSVDVKNIRLQRLGLKLPYPVTGRGDFNGQLTGTPAHPIFTGQLLAKKLTIKGQEITNVTGHVLLDGQDVRIPDLEFHQGEETVQLSGGMNLDTQTVSGTAELTNGSVSRLLSIFDVTPDTLTGKINGQVRVTGRLDNPTIFLNGKLTGGTIKRYPLDTVDLDLEMVNHVITINQFAAKQGTGNLVVTGSADLKGPLHLNMFGNGIDSGILPAWLGIKLPVHGGAVIAVEVTGDIKNPQGAVSVGVQNGTIDNEKFDSLTGSFIVTNKLIDINQITLTKDSYMVSATGTIPLETLTKQEPLEQPLHFPTHYSQVSGRLIGDDEMDVKVMLDQADLSVLPLLSNKIAWASGATKGNLVINGTPSHPKLYGELAVASGTVKFASLKDPLTHLAIDIQLKGDKIVINTVHGQMGKGNFSLNGSVALQGRTLTDYDFKLKLDKLELKHPNFSGPVSGNLTLLSTAGRPLLGGQILLENDTIDVPALPDFTPGMFDMALNVDVVAGKNLRFYNSYMYDFDVDGKVNFGGNLQKVTPSGKFTVSHGQLTYFTAPFKIQSGSAEFTPHDGLMPVIKMESQYSLQQTTVTLTVNGLATNMNFKLTSNPSLSQQQILSLLTLRNRYFDRQATNGGDPGFGRDQVNSLVNSGLEAQLFGPVENSLRSFFGVDDFHIVHNYDTPLGAPNNAAATEEVYDLEISKYLTDRFSINYSMGIDHTSEKIGVRYEFSQHFSLGTSLDSRHGFKVDALTKYQF